MIAKHPWRVWGVACLCLTAVLAGMVWLSATALELERSEAKMRRDAAVEENVRLALWRMDSLLSSLTGPESARAHYVYRSFYPARRANGQGETEPILVPSPLIRQVSEFIPLHFQFEPDGELTSPQVPSGDMRKLAEESYKTREQIENAAEQLEELADLLDRQELLARLPDKPALPGRIPKNVIEYANTAQQTPKQQVAKNQLEWHARMRNNFDNQKMQIRNAKLPRQKAATTSPDTDVTPDVMRPVWIGDALVLARRVHIDGELLVQGCRLDWGRIKPWLLDNISDLLPSAGLEPVKAENADGRELMLASLPARIIPGDIVSTPANARSPVFFALVMAWGCIIAGTVATGLLLRGAMSLSERRGAFVSAVTHELRTPLTTFRLYSEMLAEGMVPDEAKRQRYLKKLHGEADRLGHLVENVLAYARLERGNHDSRKEPVTLSALLARFRDRLASHARQGEMELILDVADGASDAQLNIDASAVEQILFNLVDNARKYAASAGDRRIHIEAETTGRNVEVRVRDHGPGISRDEAGRLFRPFCKSAKEAANSAPGVGLGLALSRRIALELGGSLSIDHGCSEGACFVLSLPAC